MRHCEDEQWEGWIVRGIGASQVDAMVYSRRVPAEAAPRNMPRATGFLVQMTEGAGRANALSVSQLVGRC